jgi:hypothetical protein
MGEGQRGPVDRDPVCRVAAKDFPEDILRFVTVSRRSHDCASFLRVPHEDLTLYVKNSMPSLAYTAYLKRSSEAPVMIIPSPLIFADLMLPNPAHVAQQTLLCQGHLREVELQ